MKKKVYIDGLDTPEEAEYVAEVFESVGITDVECNLLNGFAVIQTDIDDEEIDDMLFEAGLDCEGIENI